MNVQAFALYGTVECRQHEGTIEADDIISWVGQAFIEAAVNGLTAPGTSDPEELLTFLAEHGGLPESSIAHLRGSVTRLDREPPEAGPLWLEPECVEKTLALFRQPAADSVSEGRRLETG